MAESIIAVTVAEVDPQTAPPQVEGPRTLREIISTQLQSLSVYHRAVLETGDVEAVHKMRVTTRRLQAALDLLQSRPDDRQVIKLKKRLRKWRRWLSDIRNYDVFLIRIENDAALNKPTNQEMRDLLKSELTARRADTVARLRPRLESIAIDEIAAALGLNQEAVEEGMAHKPGSLSIHLHDERRIALRAAERLEQRLVEFQAMASLALPQADPVELHHLRISAKRLRYLLEILAEMGYGNATPALNWLRKLQDKIGEWHDLVAQEEEVIRIVSRPEFLKNYLKRSSKILSSAAHMRKKRNKMAGKIFPLKVPKSLTATARRFTRTLRRRAISD
ncbi:MAG TPA: CHAD domain-containing protein [Blastocatellia bacterium]|nr:CHAD domain-containing protein [Blastocatellia bacterium]